MLRLVEVSAENFKKLKKQSNLHTTYVHRYGEDEYVYGIQDCLVLLGVNKNTALQFGFLLADKIKQFESCKLYISVAEANVIYYHKKLL